jgi:RNA polymerase sigma factor (sigma-70 family)
MSGSRIQPDDDRRRRFELLAFPHLDAAYNFARWLTGNATDAEDIVLDAYLRAYQHFDTVRGRKFRVWLLAIVRNVFLISAKENRSDRMVFVTETPAGETAEIEETMWGSAAPDPDCQLMESIGASDALARMMENLPTEYREILLLREVEELSYKEIATVSGVPIGRVMPRLFSARLALRTLWQQRDDRESTHAAPGQLDQDARLSLG